MQTAGITSQYGFLYQRYVFIKTVIDNVGMDKFFVYEGVDDIDVSETEAIMATSISKDKFIQAKSGTVSRDCWAKIIGNWLLIDNDYSSYQVVLENDLTFDVNDDEIIDHVYNYFFNGKDRKASSIAYKVYKKLFKSNEESDVKQLIMDLEAKVFRLVLPLEELKEEIEATYKSCYCQDITVFEMAKNCRFDRFIERFQKNIDDAISKKSSFIIRYQDFFNIINKVNSEISDQKYTIETSEVRKRKKPEAEQLLLEDKLREVKQLRLVNTDNGFIVNELVKELLYKDFRNIYAGPSDTQVSNMEDIAYTNYEDVLYSLPDNPKASEVFKQTTQKDIPSTIIDSSPIYRNGCYVYLTGEDIEKDKQITWGQKSE